MAKKELHDQSIKFTVIDNGRPRKRQIIGHLLCPLKSLSFENEEQVLKKKKETLSNTATEFNSDK